MGTNINRIAPYLEDLINYTHFYRKEKAPISAGLHPRGKGSWGVHGVAAGGAWGCSGCCRRHRGRAGHCARQAVPRWRCTRLPRQQGQLPAPLPTTGFRCPALRPWATPGAPHAAPGGCDSSLGSPMGAAGMNHPALCPLLSQHPNSSPRGVDMRGWMARASSGASPSAAVGCGAQPCQDPPRSSSFRLPPSQAGFSALTAGLGALHNVTWVSPDGQCPQVPALLPPPLLPSFAFGFWGRQGCFQFNQPIGCQTAKLGWLRDTLYQENGFLGSGAARPRLSIGTVGWTHRDSLEELNRRTSPRADRHHFLPPG